jgi:hypothetical protein
MKHLSSVLILFTCFLFSNAQSVKKTTSKKSVFNKTEKEATFPGGATKLGNFFTKKFKSKHTCK